MCNFCIVMLYFYNAFLSCFADYFLDTIQSFYGKKKQEYLVSPPKNEFMFWKIKIAYNIFITFSHL